MDSYDAERIAKLERQVAQLYRHLNLEPESNVAAPFSGAAPQPAFGTSPQPAFGAGQQPAFGSTPPAPGAGAPFPPSFADALRRGRLIEAIKIYRQVTGLGLKDAKEAVEAMIRGDGA